MLTTLEGRMGQGKTLSGVAFAVDHRSRTVQTALEVLKGLPAGSITYEKFKEELSLPEYISALEAENADEEMENLIELLGLAISELEDDEDLQKAAEKILPDHMLEFVAKSEISLPVLHQRLKKLRPVKIYATFHLNYIKSELFDFPKFAKLLEAEQVEEGEESKLILEHCIIILDESYLFMDSRTSGSKMNRTFNTFVFQTRKRGVEAYLPTHSLDRLDKRVRAAIDIRGRCRFEPARQIVRVRFTDLHTGLVNSKKIYGPLMYPFYDTEEIVIPKGKLYRVSEKYAK